eukprot:CAMPEP_0113669066 /NCGR_PEP_ID=MMETSP0038_2-20120614/4361_1 /TAXON_ID=2898 /ORGANISM="Cryptomonas paramecium" /LENGTH=37 /DNA_ID=CAMNT_0000584903 /DNA_START=42 /DNA_END=152 /DNA_ORIENTATION=+ /assembly_acc=CAM_ASM_000170
MAEVPMRQFTIAGKPQLATAALGADPHRGAASGAQAI